MGRPKTKDQRPKTIIRPPTTHDPRLTTRIGILGGTFDPPHQGHIALAKEARRRLDLDRVFFVPTYMTPLKGRRPTPARHRVEMLKLAVRRLPFARVSLFEVRRPRISYTIDTVRHFRRRMGKRAQIFVLTGNDVLGQIGKWKALDAILGEARFVVAVRPGTARKALPAGFLRLGMRPCAASSTRIRARVARGKGRVPLLDPAVLAYAQAHRLYGKPGLC